MFNIILFMFCLLQSLQRAFTHNWGGEDRTQLWQKPQKSIISKCDSSPSAQLAKYERLQQKMPMEMEPIEGDASAREICLKWKMSKQLSSTSEECLDNFEFRLGIDLIELEGGNGRSAIPTDFAGVGPVTMSFSADVRSFSFCAIPGSKYAISLDLFEKTTGRYMAFCGITIRATFSLHEIAKLMDKATAFIGPVQMQPFTNLHRAKPNEYWDNIRMEDGQIMRTYPKDSNGQAASPINQAIQGLFFNAYAYVPSESSVGNWLLTIPALDLLNPDRTNLYFADFYCNQLGSKHYVTIVATLKGSDTDSFCRHKLIWLPPFDNPFLRFGETTPDSAQQIIYKFANCKRVWLELYYTEDIPMPANFVNSLQPITPTGNGRSLPRGLPIANSAPYLQYLCHLEEHAKISVSPWIKQYSCVLLHTVFCFFILCFHSFSIFEMIRMHIVSYYISWGLNGVLICRVLTALQHSTISLICSSL